MLDPDFSIHLFYINQTNNNTASYSIMMDGQTVSQGAFRFNKTVDLHLNNTDMIGLLTVTVNNATVLSASTIFITEGITQAGIRRVSEPYTIKLLPWQWSGLQWNIFYGVVTASLLSLVMGYRLVRWYRKQRGVQEIT